MRNAERPFRLSAVSDPRLRLDVGPPFRRLNGGWLALDFVNTVAGWITAPAGEWGDTVREERLRTYEDLVHWAEVQGWLEPARSAALRLEAEARPAAAEAVVRRARTLRGALFRIFKAHVERWDPLAADLEVLNLELGRLRRGETVVPRDGGYAVEWESDAAELDVVLWPPLRSAVTLLTSPELLAQVGQCGGPECGWLFLGTGRGRPRRWCDIRDCGNVAKVQAFRRRQHPW